MAESYLHIGVNASAQLGGLNQTVAAINQVTAAQQRQAAVNAQRQQGTGVAQAFSSSALQGVGLGGLTGGVAGAVGAGVGALIGFVKVLTDSAGRTRDVAEQLNLTTTEFQKLERAASETGVPMNRLAGSLGLLDQQRKAAAEGNGALRAAFAAVGVSLEDLNSESVRAIDLQARLAGATTNMTEQQRAAVRVLLGAQGARLLPALAAMQAMKDADVASPEAIANVDEFGKAWERVWAGIKKRGVETLAELNTGLQMVFTTMLGAPTPDARPNKKRDEQEYVDQIALGVAPEAVRGGAKGFRDFEAYAERQRQAAIEADRAMREAGKGARDAEATAGELELDGGSAGDIAKAKARGETLREEEKRQLTLRHAARKAANTTYTDFSESRGGGQRLEAFEAEAAQQAKAEAKASAAMRKAAADAAQAEQQAASGGPPLAVAAARARGTALRAEEQRQRGLRDTARTAGEKAEAQFQQRGPDAPQAPGLSAPMFVDQAAAKELAELDKQRLENAEKRRKLEFDLLTPAQQRADIERRIAEEADIIAGDPDALRAAQAQGRKLDLEAQLAGTKDTKADAPLPVNQWEKLGAGFGGGGADARQAELVRNTAATATAAAQSAAALTQTNNLLLTQLGFWHL